MAGGFKKQARKFLKILFVLALAVVFLWGCSSTLGKKKKRRQDSASRQKHFAKKKHRKRNAPAERRANPRSMDDLLDDSSSPAVQWIFPTRVNEIDRSVMILVPAGEYLLGPVGNSNALAEGRIQLPDFYIDRAEISVEQFQNYDPSYDEKVFNNGEKCPSCPAMGIPWMVAQSYCRWAGKRLPTEAEWEAAARGDQNSKWPWGSIFDPNKANLEGDADGYAGPAPVRSFPASPFGTWDMAGNVWEWVAMPYEPRPIPGSGGKLTAQIVKGGGWSSNKDSARVSSRNPLPPDIKNPNVGFRCVFSTNL